MAFRLLTIEDMKGIKTTDSPLGTLAAVACRAKEIHESQESNICIFSDNAGKFSGTEAAAALNPNLERRAVDNGPQPPPLPEEFKNAILETARGKPKRRAVDDGPQPPPPLPEEFKNAILKMAGGRNILPETLVIQKGLYETDLSEGHNRISMPMNKISGSFLSEEEKEFLCRRDRSKKMNYKEVNIIEPSLEWEKGRLSRWDMAKGKGKTCSTYVIKGTWRYIVHRNGLRVGNVVQLWAFRIEDELCFALVKLPN